MKGPDMTHPIEDAEAEIGKHTCRMLKRAGLKTLEDVSVAGESWLRAQYRVGDRQIVAIIHALHRRKIPLFGFFHDFRPDGRIIECEWQTGWNKVLKRDAKFEEEAWDL